MKIITVFKNAAWIPIVFCCFACSSLNVDVYKNENPKLVLEEYLNGDLTAHGVFLDRKGQVKKRFECKIKGTWKNGVGTLDESFTYSDGTTSKRIWTLTKKSDQAFEGTASDVVGVAKGEIAGNALKWTYVLALDVDGSTYNVNFEDWMYLMSNKVMLNKSVMTKFGFYLGEVILTFNKP